MANVPIVVSGAVDEMAKNYDSKFKKDVVPGVFGKIPVSANFRHLAVTQAFDEQLGYMPTLKMVDGVHNGKDGLSLKGGCVVVACGKTTHATSPNVIVQGDLFLPHALQGTTVTIVIDHSTTTGAGDSSGEILKVGATMKPGDKCANTLGTDNATQVLQIIMQGLPTTGTAAQILQHVASSSVTFTCFVDGLWVMTSSSALSEVHSAQLHHIITQLT